MKLSTFTAENAQEAVRVVQQNLGPEAVIINVRQLPAQGLSRLLQRHGHLEVTACVPDAPTPTPVVPPRENLHAPAAKLTTESSPSPHNERRWRSIAWLESLGLLPEFADRLENKLRSTNGDLPPPNPIAEWNLVRDSLTTFWRPTHKTIEKKRRPHVFIGPAGVGKTTVICKWLTSSVLRGEEPARVWRLDGETVNTSEFLSLHCELLGVPVERFWNHTATIAENLWFVDLPGVETHDAAGMKLLREQLQTLPAPHIHLVLNAAYDTEVLFEQFHAFAPLQPEDVIFTHLDEEQRRVKLWNFVIGKNCPLGWLAGGQKLPGTFVSAEASELFPQKNLR